MFRNPFVKATIKKKVSLNLTEFIITFSNLAREIKTHKDHGHEHTYAIKFLIQIVPIKLQKPLSTKFIII